MESIPQKQPQAGLPWTLELGGQGKTTQFSWPDIDQALDRLHINDGGGDSYLILEQKNGEDYWFIQCAVALKGPHAGQYIVGCGWSDPDGPALVEWYGGYQEAVEHIRAVWEGRGVDFTGFEDLSYELPANQRKALLKIILMEVGELGTNCYILIEQQQKLAAVIDPGGDAPRIISQLHQQGVTLRYILLTHGHYDHTGGVPELLAAFPQAEVYIHPKDYPGPDSGLFPLYTQLGGDACPNIRYYKAFNDRDVPTPEAREIPLGGLTIHPIHTWGHSDGSVSLRVNGGPIFCGDTLFQGSCGRTDFPGGSEQKMLASLRMFGLMHGDAAVYPGHMAPTTLEEERRSNPYVRQALRAAP